MLTTVWPPGSPLGAAIRFLRRQGAARVVLAVPVAAADSARALAAEADELVAVETRDDFFAVGQFYGTFDQTEDSEVRSLLAEPGSRSAFWEMI